MWQFKRASGFTLLELLVVLAIVAMATGLAAPSMSRWIERNQTRAWHSDLLATLNAQPLEAYRRGRGFSLDAAMLRQAVPTLPPEVELVVEAPIVYTDNGSTQGGRVVLRRTGQADEAWSIQGVTGAVKIWTAVNPQ